MLKYDANKPVSAQFLEYAYDVAKVTGCCNHRDANETMIFARMLEHIYAQTYDILYPELKARKFIPVDGSVPTGAEFFTYRAFDKVGIAQMIANYADDLPDVTVLGKEYTGRCRSMGVGYTYSLQDVRNAMMANQPLESVLAQVARRTIEVKHDQIAAFGDPSLLPTTGFLNNANVPLVSPTTGNWDTLGTTTTPLQVVADLNKLCNAIFTTSLEIHQPDTLLLDTATYALLNAYPMSTTTTITDETVLSYFLKHNPFIKQCDSWTLLSKADAGGTKPRAMAYQRSPQNMQLVIPQEFEQLPPQPKSLGWKVPCHSRTGGVKWTYPLSAAYMDSIHS